jgi:hypothetical protein
MPRTLCEKVELAYQSGPHDKVYHIELTEDTDGYRVVGYNGRRGARLTPQSKTPRPVSYPLAREIFERLLRSKLHHPRTPYRITARQSAPAPAAPTPKSATPAPSGTPPGSPPATAPNAPAEYQAPHLAALEL